MEEFLHLLHAVLCQVDCLFLLIYNEISCLLDILSHDGIHLGELSARLASLKLAGQDITRLVKLRGLPALPGNDKRCSCLVNQHGVNLVNDGKMKPSLYELLLVYDHVVTEIVKSQFVVRHIGDIAVIRGAALLVVHTV